ncbi:hypothetical protein [Micromonospora tulbaghiae]|uniref:Uncharacterized protein n=1 Tax=Micromonospora tulbaghiae TaxID=479978 RepID=A0ABY0KS93_9ACTN|nr:hypothetical protein [Micromonospora tulbaghiae]SCF05473.1 hypothetical protein GA0070562_5655 [Micromonospora tulbaghiae]
MLSPRRALRAAAARLRHRRPYWLGTPLRATITAAASGGYTLLIDYNQGTEWVDLPPRTEPYDRPDEREFTAVAAALAARRLIRTTPWQIDAHGRLFAPVVVFRPGKATR